MLSLLLCVFSAGIALYGYLRWLNNEKAMRLKQDFVYTRGLKIISIAMMLIAAVVIVMVIQGG